YMAPEQYDESFGRIGPETDIWALGVILYELLCGKRPFAGADRRELKPNICQRAPAPLPIVRGWKTRSFDRIVRRCLEKDPSQRSPTALALADDLAVCRQGRLKSWALRHRRLVTAAGGAAVLVAFLTIGLLGWHEYVAKARATALHLKEAAWNARAKG